MRELSETDKKQRNYYLARTIAAVNKKSFNRGLAIVGNAHVDRVHEEDGVILGIKPLLMSQGFGNVCSVMLEEGVVSELITKDARRKNLDNPTQYYTADYLIRICGSDYRKVIEIPGSSKKMCAIL